MRIILEFIIQLCIEFRPEIGLLEHRIRPEQEVLRDLALRQIQRCGEGPRVGEFLVVEVSTCIIVYIAPFGGGADDAASAEEGTVFVLSAEIGGCDVHGVDVGGVFNFPTAHRIADNVTAGQRCAIKQEPRALGAVIPRDLWKEVSIKADLYAYRSPGGIEK